MSPPIYVTRPSLAPLDEYLPYLESIWESGVMTHNGPLVQRLEKDLCAYLDVPNVVCVANGTCALQLAMRALGLAGEVITTPFTFIATANIIAWERCRPIFVDVDPDTWNLDPNRIEERVTADTVAILPVHVFSAPCDTAGIQAIADRHGLRVIYDAAHAMAVNVGGCSVLRRGDVSAVSFHATKLFNTAEGGACVTDDDELAERIRRMRFFGFDARKDIVDSGMNAKMTEVHAGLGLANLARLDEVRENRREKYELYRALLSAREDITFQGYAPGEYNYSYMPVVFESEALLLRVMDALAKEEVYPRRYFYPALNTVGVFEPQPELPVAERIARTVLCLPLYDTLARGDIERIAKLILSV
ncbi:MAG: DegT/DnrJ/EryC1/StrS family aminotransferase [Candidatus Hydrogenedentes bacterium]|nr:DegT/DnrJ/EryC1/StrS family aminotransferase [Candidatus Hydrogenedentota bacterium]